MLQHVSLEVPPAEVEATIGFWGLLGFARIAEPEPLRGHVTWLERGGTQIHLIHTEGATVPTLGHTAVVVEELGPALERLADAGHETDEARELWGARRVFATAPAGHRVELMEFAPPAP